jgi:uncharacterized protein YdhG (YjbR/CyaY superfamily)
MKDQTNPAIDEYIQAFPEPARSKLAEIRRLVRELVPEAEERISYRMPAFFLKRNLVYFAGYAGHIGFYPGAAAIARFEDELSGYKHAKGSVQFPLDEPLPLDLIGEMVRFKVEENRPPASIA